MLGGYFLYTHNLKNRAIGAWDLVPSDALAVYESDNCKSCIEKTKETAVWTVFNKASLYNKAIDSLRDDVFTLLSPGANYLLSVHATKKDDFDFIVFYPQLQKAVSLFSDIKNKSSKFSTREFSSITINEVHLAGQILSWCVIDNILVASFTPFLIEDVIRTYDASKDNFKKTLSSLRQLTKIRGDAGNLYLRLNALEEIVSVFSREYSTLLNSFGKVSVLDIKAEDNNLSLNGFSADTSALVAGTLSLFRSQSPVSFKLENFIPNRTIALNNLGISNGNDFNKDLINYRKSKAAHLNDTLKKIGSSLNVDLNALYNNIEDEIAICYVESFKRKGYSKILFIETAKYSSWIKVFSDLSAKLSVDTIFYEKFGNYQIKDVPVFRFPEKILWPLVNGFDDMYYTNIGNTIIIGDDLDELKKVLTDIDEDDTWGKSVSVNKFLGTTLLEANISFYVNTPKVWSVISSSLHPKWNKFIRDNQKLVSSLQMGAIQFSNLNHSYYTNISWNYKTVEAAGQSPPRERYVTRLNSNITRIHAVKSHISKSDELLVQDSLNDLALLSNEGEVLWKKSIGDPIVGEIYQIDFLANGKLQYFFATKDALHVIDRLGNYVSPYPLRLSVSDIEHVSVIDYDHSKRYRFIVTESSGKIWMYDKEGNDLDGWNPKDLASKLLMSPQHYRIKGRDYIIGVSNNGVVHLMNRRGESIKGFPLDVKARLRGDFFLETGRATADTYFVVVDEDGFKVKFNIEGKIVARETLLKSSVTSKFYLLNEKNAKSYLVVQQDARQFKILDQTGKQIISNDFTGSNPAIVNFYDFGSGKSYISVTDLTQELTYIYDMEGNLLTSPPVESSLLTLRPKESGQIRIYYIQNNAVVIESL